MKVASFHVRATEAQSVRWKQAADAEGHRSAGTWLAAAADAYLKVRARAGRPIPLAWRHGWFPVVLASGEEVSMPGFVSPPFGAYRGAADGRGVRGRQRYTLVHLPERRIIATLRAYRQCQALASELASALLRRELPEPAGIVERHTRESF